MYLSRVCLFFVGWSDDNRNTHNYLARLIDFITVRIRYDRYL